MSGEITWARGPKNAFREVPQPPSTGPHPTKTRLALLKGVKRNEVTGYPGYGDHRPPDYYQDGDGNGRKVTTRIEELMRAGWVEKGKADEASPYSTFRVRLTEAGRKVLEEADRG